MQNRQEIGRHIEQQGGNDQRQTAPQHMGPMAEQFETAAGALGMLTRYELGLEHQQVALMAGNQLI
ncbi:hypothetical protein GCM10027514_44330 [Azotobacter armeniacus]